MWQAVDHIYAAGVWMLNYVDKHKIPIADDASFATFKHHMIRLTAILRTLDYPVPRNPILSDESLQDDDNRRRDDRTMLRKSYMDADADFGSSRIWASR